MATVVNVAFLVVLSFFVLNSEGDSNCDTLGVLFYEDLGCWPRLTGNCPNRYECDLVTSGAGCKLGTQYYDNGQAVDDKIVQEVCDSCRCTSNGTGDYDFVCSSETCHNNQTLELGCYNKFEPGTCCSNEEICPEKTPVGECEVKGEKYKEGQRFYPKGTCLKCVCPKNFKGKLEEEFCRRRVCASQLHYKKELVQNCAPYYNNKKGDVLCCPSGFVCPNLKEEIKTVSRINSRLKCKFGSNILKKGEGFETEYVSFGNETLKLECECYLPPFVTCWNKGRL